MYIESIFILDFWINFLIIYATSIVLKRKIKLFNAILSSFIGSISVIILFLNISEIQRIILKIYFSILIILFAFKYKNLKYTFINLTTFYLINIVLGGVFYLFKIESFYNSIFFLFILSPIIIYIYIRQAKLLKTKEELFLNVKICIGKKTLDLIGFLDSGNTLTYKQNPVIITNISNDFDSKKFYIPYNTIGNYGLLECIKTDKVIVNNKEYKNVMLGFSENFEIEGANILLNTKMGE